MTDSLHRRARSVALACLLLGLAFPATAPLARATQSPGAAPAPRTLRFARGAITELLIKNF